MMTTPTQYANSFQLNSMNMDQLQQEPLDSGRADSIIQVNQAFSQRDPTQENVLKVDMKTKNDTAPFRRSSSRATIALETIKFIFPGIILIPVRFCLIMLIVLSWYLFSRIVVFTDWLFICSPKHSYKSIDDLPLDSPRRIMFSWLKDVIRVGLFVSGFHRIHRIFLSGDDIARLQQHPENSVFDNNSLTSNNDRDTSETREDIEYQMINGSDQHYSQNSLSETDSSCYITVCNHVSFCDVFMVLEELGAVGMLSKGSLQKVPIIGRFMQQIGCLFYDESTRSNLLDMMKEEEKKYNEDTTRAKLVIFPEGTTTNGTSLLRFHRGAFVNGSPVKPMIVHYPYRHFNVAWDSINIFLWFPRFLCQFYNSCTIIHFPVYYPNQLERENPDLYAENVRELMSKGMNYAVPNKNMTLSNVFFCRMLNKEPKASVS